MSARERIITALRGGPATLNELHEKLGGERKKLVWSINDTIGAGFIERHNIEGEPGYRMTQAGRDWTPRRAPAAAAQAASPAGGGIENTGSVGAEAPPLAVSDTVQSRPGSNTDAPTSEARGRLDDIQKDMENQRALINKLQHLIRVKDKELEALRAQVQGSDEATEEAVDVKDAARGYLVKAPKRKPAVVGSPDAAVRRAMAAAKNGSGYGEVFALVPIGRAVRGAEWKPR